MGAKRWSDQLEGKIYEIKIWKTVTVVTSSACVFLGIATLLLAMKVSSDFKSERVILVPGIQRSMTVPAGTFFSESFIKGVATRIVELQEQWTYETLEDHYKELFKLYYGHGLEQITRANLKSTDRINYVRKNKMVSTFKFDFKRSEFKYCKKIQKSCSLVVGTRKVFVENNMPFAEKQVAYLIISDGIWPTDDHPFALKAYRVIIDDSTSNPYDNIKNQLEAAKNGVMPNES